MESFQLRVVTPGGNALTCPVSSAVLPGIDGEIGILPGHCHYVGLLAAGALRYVQAGQSAVKEISIGEGSCEYKDNVLTVLAE
jgi:F-type H+-transporting ATPase subunit epsilon